MSVGAEERRGEKLSCTRSCSCYTESGGNRREMHLLMFSHVDASAVALPANCAQESAGQRNLNGLQLGAGSTLAAFSLGPIQFQVQAHTFALGQIFKPLTRVLFTRIARAPRSGCSREGSQISQQDFQPPAPDSCAETKPSGQNFPHLSFSAITTPG